MKKLFELLSRPGNYDLGLLIVRLWLGAMLILHGQGKLLGGMPGFIAYVGKLGIPLPEVMAWAAALSEFAGGVMILTGLFFRPVLLFVISTMAVAAFIAHAGDPFSKKELALTYGILSTALLITNAGTIGLDNYFYRRRR